MSNAAAHGSISASATTRRVRDGFALERVKGHLFAAAVLIAAAIGVVALGILIIYVVADAWGWVDWQFLTSTPSRFPEKAGVMPSMLGSLYVMLVVAVLSLPIGAGTAVYLEEYAGKSTFKRIVEMNIANLAGVPSIVYGLLGLGVFVSWLGLPHGIVLVGGFTLTLRVLPIVIVSAQEAIRAVPDSQRQAAFGLGVTRWQMIRSVTIPEAMPGIMTGMILAVANGMGETAPLIMIGAATSIFSPPHGLFSNFSALPLQIYAWSDYPAAGFQHGVTPAAIVVLLVILLSLNGVAIIVRQRFRRKLGKK